MDMGLVQRNQSLYSKLLFGGTLIQRSLISVLSWWTLRKWQKKEDLPVCQQIWLISRVFVWDRQNYRCSCGVLLILITRSFQKVFGSMGKDIGRLIQHLNWEMTGWTLLGSPLGCAAFLSMAIVFFPSAHGCSFCSPLKHDHGSLFCIIPLGWHSERSILFYR